MQVEFVSRGDGWRKSGRPRKEVPTEVLDILRYTYDNGQQANFSVAGASEPEIKALIQLLDRGAKQLGKRLRQQAHMGVLRFYLEDS